MRANSGLLLLAASLVATPVLAADRTEVIPLAFLSATELDQFMTSDTIGTGVGGLRRGKGIDGKDRLDLMPKGISAWAVDARKNAVSVSGSDEAIDQLKKIVRLLDIPARQIRISVRLVELSPAGAAALRARPDAVAGEGVTSATLTSPEDRKPLEGLPALFTTTLQVSNNRKLHLRVPSAAGEDSRRASLVPRVNGDGSITVIATALSNAKPDRDEHHWLFRVSTGQSRVILDAERRAWVITPELLPDPAP